MKQAITAYRQMTDCQGWCEGLFTMRKCKEMKFERFGDVALCVPKATGPH